VTPRAGAERSALLRLIVIIDHDAARGRDCAALAAAAERGGATMLQVRAKQLGPGQIAGLTRQIIAAVSLPVIVNDRFDVAIATGAAGCHLGPADLPLDVARRLAPAGFILGGSASGRSTPPRTNPTRAARSASKDLPRSDWPPPSPASPSAASARAISPRSSKRAPRESR
jgi:hypothetical protein